MTSSEQINAISSQVRENFTTLSSSQLNWKPSPEKWSIAQCLDHLLTTDKHYFKTFDKLINSTYRPSWFTRISPFTNFWTNLFEKNITSEVKKKVKSPSVFRPSSSSHNTIIVQEYLQHLKVLKNYYQELHDKKFATTIVPSPAASFITLKLWPLLDINLAHEQRHINQAKNVLNHPQFPK